MQPILAPSRKERRLQRALQRRPASRSTSRITTCSVCSKRYITHSGSNLCVGCRGIDSASNRGGEKLVRDSDDSREITISAITTRDAAHVVDTSATGTSNDNGRYSGVSNVSQQGKVILVCARTSKTSTTATAKKGNANNAYEEELDGERSGNETDKQYEGPQKSNDTEITRYTAYDCGGAARTLSKEEPSNSKPSTMRDVIASDEEGSSNKQIVHTLSKEEPSNSEPCTMRDEIASDEEESSNEQIVRVGSSIKVEMATGHESSAQDTADNTCDNTDDDPTNTAIDQTKKKKSDSEKRSRDYRKDQHAASSLFFSTSSKSDSRYKCFICNADLSRIQTGLKGRMNHIKRCGKKYGIRAGDGTGELDSHDAKMVGMDCTTTTSGASGKGAPESNWHDDADAESSMTIEMHISDIQQDGKCTVSSKTQQRLNSYFSRPVRSLDKVLLQGARNDAKRRKIALKRKVSPSPTAETNKRRGGGGWHTRREAPTNCPSHKRIGNTSILVDAFHYANPALPQTHFLSHFHSDHYGGLTKHWKHGVIYCSGPTAILCNSQLGVEKKYLHPLPINAASVVEANGRSVSVTLIDANHCPGAVMFLFELPSGKKVLHVGDFRWNRDKMLSFPPLREVARGANNGARLDEIYLDTTYCDEKYTMPTQETAIAATIDIAVKEVEGSFTPALLPNCILPRKKCATLLLFGSYTIGKEKIYMSCAKALGLRIYVEPKKLRILSALNFSAEQMKMFTTIKSEAQIYVIPMARCSFKHMDSYLADANASAKGLSVEYTRVVAFRPTGWSYSVSNKSLISTRRNGNKTIHGVPYSEHSSFAELVDCLLCLRPKRIVPTVSVSSSQAQIELLLQAAHAREEDEQYHD